VTPRTKRARISSFLNDLGRAEALYDLLVSKGGVANAVGKHKRFRQPEKRDIAQFIFFEIAAKFEGFTTFCFQYEVSRRFRVTGPRAYFLMGSSDRGIDGTFGWASPDKLKERGFNLFGRERFFGRFEQRLGKSTRETLAFAHLLRNKVAHEGGEKWRKKLEKYLNELHIPKRTRQGLSVGRLIMDYPAGVTKKRKLFFKILSAYVKFARQFRKHSS
jgi:hypothetical protein